MAENNQTPDADKALQDGIISASAFCHLVGMMGREEHEEKILNGALSMVCTYPEDYKERQSIYSCLTCQNETGQLAGICFACSENCHDDHEVVQLYTKRMFCCDCGNSKFKNKCKLFEAKSDVNRKNRYSHNFEGKYCTCNLPYPPPEDDPSYGKEMSQCFMCEDWFHPHHIDVESFSEDEYIELVCPSCSTKYPFIIPYQFICEQQDKLDASASNKTADQSELNATTSAEADIDYCEPLKSTPIDNTSTENQSDCYYEKIKSVVPDLTTPRALIFHNVDWRPMLCRCIKCKRMYEDLECEFLLDEKDSLHHYLSNNAKEVEKNKGDTQTELFNEIALRTNADVAHYAILEIATAKHKLKEFIVSKAEKQEVIDDKDIYSFFDSLKAAKRRRFEDPSEEDH